MWMTLLLVVLVLVGAVLLFASTRPDIFRVERSLPIKAPPERIFALLDDFHHWPEWSPWEALDPDMTRTHSGKARGTGAVYEWQGNSKVGHGRMEITHSSAPSKLGFKLDFLRPFEAHNTAEFTLQPQGDATLVHWAMSGPAPFISKLVGLVISMDRLVGKDFEVGLANLKAVTESG